MTQENLTIAIKRLSDYKSNDKAGLWYMLRSVNFEVYGYAYEQSYTRKEILAFLIEAVQTDKGFKRLTQFNGYRDLAINETLTVSNLETTEKDAYICTTNNNKENMENLVGKIESVLSGLNKGGFFTIVQKYSIMGDERIKIAISTSDKLINGVRGQYPDLISFSLDSDLNLQSQSFGGSGGGSLYRNINPENSDEKYLAMKSVKVPFRKPQQTEKAVLSALERLTVNYYETLMTFKRQNLLRYADLADYDNLLV